jgi:hypothetical protein
MCELRKISVGLDQDKGKYHPGGGRVRFGSGLIGVNNQVPSGYGKPKPGWLGLGGRLSQISTWDRNLVRCGIRSG